MGNAVLKEFDVKEQPTGSGGLSYRWRVFPCEQKVAPQGRTSVLILAKEELPKHLRTEVFYNIIRAGATRMARLRHPGVLRVQQPLDESRSAFALVTEPVVCSLGNLLGRSDNLNGMPSPVIEMGLSELDIKNGLRQVAETLLFLHKDAKMYHLNIDRTTIFVTPAGDWKVAGFYFALQVQHRGEKASPGFDFRDIGFLPMLPSLAASAPDVVLDSKCDQTSDVFSLGLLALHAHRFVSGKRDTESIVSNVESYTNYLKQIDRMTGDLPSPVSTILKGLLSRDSTSRMQLEAFLASKYFDDTQIRCIRYLDSLFEKDIKGRIAFLKRLPQALSMFEESTIMKKVLPPLLLQAKDEKIAVFALTSILTIAEKMNASEFTDRILPTLKPLLTRMEPPQLPFLLLKNLGLLMTKTSNSDQRDYVIPLLISSMGARQPQIKLKALEQLAEVASKNVFEFRELRSKILPKVRTTCSEAGPLGIRIGGLKCMSSMLKLFDSDTVQNEVLSAVDEAFAVDKSPQLLMAALDVYRAVTEHSGVQVAVGMIVPKLFPMALSDGLSLDQFRSFMHLIHELTERLERIRSEELAKSTYISKEVSAADAADDPFEANATFDQFLESEFNGTAMAPSPEPIGGGVRSARMVNSALDFVLSTDSSGQSAATSGHSLQQSVPIANSTFSPTLASVASMPSSTAIGLATTVSLFDSMHLSNPPSVHSSEDPFAVLALPAVPMQTKAPTWPSAQSSQWQPQWDNGNVLQQTKQQQSTAFTDIDPFSGL